MHLEEKHLHGQGHLKNTCKDTDLPGVFSTSQHAPGGRKNTCKSTCKDTDLPGGFLYLSAMHLEEGKTPARAPARTLTYLGVFSTSQRLHEDYLQVLLQEPLSATDLPGFFLYSPASSGKSKCRALTCLLSNLIYLSSHLGPPSWKSLTAQALPVTVIPPLLDYRSRDPGCVTDTLRRLDTPSLQERRKQQSLVFVYKAVDGPKNRPQRL
ncbi:hypothetical protein ACOMHN_050428 [Nucella lapillus]